MRRLSIHTSIALVLAIILSAFQNITGVQALSAGDITIMPITWNVIGLDSNDPVNSGPDTFPVGVRVCNNSVTDSATNVKAKFVWDSANSNIDFTPGSYGPDTNPYPTVASLGPGKCYDFYYEIKVQRTSAAYDTTRRYHVEISIDGLATKYTARPRELYVEHLISQSRNSTTDVQLDGVSIPAGGTMVLMVGKTYDIKLVGNTATNGYEQIENYINLPNTIFQVNKITTTYTAADTVSPDLDATKKAYADGCSWVNDPNSPIYRSCTDTGKYGGDITVTYNVTVLQGAGTTKTLNNLIYDFSGSSYHYNSDFSLSSRVIAIVDPKTATITKAFSPATTYNNGASILSFTLTNPNGAPLSGANFTDSFPANMVVATPAVYSTVNCGTPTFEPVAGTSSISFSNGTIPAGGLCIVNVKVVATGGTGSYDNTSTDLFIGSIDTGSKASASLTVTSDPTPPDCTPGLELARWDMNPTSTTTPPVLTSKSTKVSSASATYSGTGAQLIDTADGSPFINSWKVTGGWASTNAGYPNSNAPYYEISLDTSKFSDVAIAFNYKLADNFSARKDNYIYIYSATNGSGSFSNIYTSTYNTISQDDWFSLPAQSAALTGSSSTQFRINAVGGQKLASSSVLLDSIVVTGCGVPDPVTISKSFATPVVQVNSSSLLSFTITNPSSVSQSGITFTDTLPSGLTVTNGSSIECGGTLTRTAPSTISFTGGTLAAGASCTTTGIAITATTAGTHVNTTGNISSTQAGTNTTASGSASATLKAISPPSISKYFAPNPIAINRPTTLTFIITNPNLDHDLTSIQFSDTYPTGMTTVNSATASTTCPAGTVTAATGGSTITFTGGKVLAGKSCSVSIDVQSSVAGDSVNTSSTVSDTEGGIGNTGSDTLTVTAAPALSVLKKVSTSSSGPFVTFLPITSATQVYYQFTIENKGDVPLTNVTISDPTLLADEANFTPCTNLSLGVDDTNYIINCVMGPVNVVSGLHTNTATASGVYNSATYTSNNSSASYATASLSISKSVTEANFAAVGDVLHYSFVITNNGSANVEGPVVVTDDKASDESCPSVETVGDLDAFLDIGENITCSATYSVTDADVTTGSVTNAAYATAAGVQSPTVIKTVTKLKASPTITTTASGVTGVAGTEGAFGDTAELSGGNSPTGSVTFTLYSDNTCAIPVAGMSGSGVISGASASYSSTWTPTAAGTYYWKASYAGDANNNPYTTGCGGLNEEIVIGKASPTITTNASGVTGVVGTEGTFGDSATLSGAYSPTGSVTFALFSDNTCATPVTGMSGDGAISGDSASFSSTWTPPAPGTYYWTASYPGDGNNNAYTTGCGGLNEEIVIDKASPTITTMANPLSAQFGALATFGDTATLAGAYSPTGPVTFTLYSDSACTVPVDGMSGDGTITGTTTSFSSDWTPPAAGNYYWIASYAGDVNNKAFTTSCGDANEVVTATKVTPTVLTSVHDASHGITTSAMVGDVVHDYVFVSGIVGTPTGSITLEYFDNGSCTAPALLTSDALALTAGAVEATDFAQTIAAAGDYSFRASYPGDANFNADTGDCEPFTVAAGILPVITVDNVANPTSVPETGASVTFTFTVTNSGTIPVTITSHDNDVFGALLGDADCAVGTPLAAGESCTFDYTTTMSGEPTDTDINYFTAHAVDADGNDATDTDDSSVNYTNVLPDISVVKTANPTHVAETGGNVVFSFVVSNDGTESVTLTSLTDDQFGDLNGQGVCTVPQTIAVGGSYTCEVTKLLASDTLTDHVNTVTAVAEDNDGSTDTATDDATVTFDDVLPVISVNNIATPDSVMETGETVTFTFTVTNTGTVPVSITSLNNDVFGVLAGDADCAVDTILAPAGGCSFEITRFMSGISGDIDTNLFTAHAEDTNGNDTSASDDSSVTYTNVLPIVEVTKTANPTSVPETGANVTFTFTVHNTGTVPVMITSLNDSIYGVLTGDADCEVTSPLDPDASCTFSLTEFVSGTGGSTHTNEFTAEVTDSDGSTASASDTADVDITDLLPSIVVAKTAEPDSVPYAGETVTFTFSVENTCSVPVTITSLNDDIYGDLIGDADCADGITLEAGATCDFTYETTVSGAPGETHTNIFTAHVTDTDGNDASDDATASVSLIDTDTSIIGLAKELVSSDLVSTGTYDLTYNFVVRNYGFRELSEIQVVDDLSLTFPDPTTFTVESIDGTVLSINDNYDGVTDTNLLTGLDTLAPGESGTITIVVRVVPASSGPFENSATVTATDTHAAEVSDVSQNGADPDPDDDLDTAEHEDPTPVSFGEDLFDPPMGIKTVDASGRPILYWTMVWINSDNHFTVHSTVHDPIPEGSTFTPTTVSSGYAVPGGAPAESTNMGVSCSAGASTTTTTVLCYYEGPTPANPRGQIIWEGDVAPDFGITDPDAAENAIHISFSVITADGVTRVSNTATIDSDLNGNGNDTDPGESRVASASEAWNVGGGGGGDPTSTPVALDAFGLPIPLTGFTPYRLTLLPAQPLNKAYTELGDFWLEIPSLGVETTIVGIPQTTTGWDVTWLGNQAGWLNGTAFPTWAGNSVITAHVYNSNGLPGPFINLPKLKYGDQIIVHAWGQDYVYEVREVKEVLPDENSVLTKHEELPWLTLVTCRGYDPVTNSYRYRYVVRAVQVKIK